MRKYEWQKLKRHCPQDFIECINTCIKIENYINKILIGAERGIFLEADMTGLMQETKRLLDFVITKARTELRPDDTTLAELKDDLVNLITMLRSKEEDKIIRNLGANKISLAFYLGEYKSLLGIIYDSIRETTIQHERDYPKDFVNIIIAKRGLYPKPMETGFKGFGHKEDDE